MEQQEAPALEAIEFVAAHPEIAGKLTETKKYAGLFYLPRV
jgi:hypothetical protein